MVQQKWKIIDNQNLADIKVEVYGKNEEDLFGNILGVFTDIVTEVDKVKEEKEIAIKKLTHKEKQKLIEIYERAKTR